MIYDCAIIGAGPAGLTAGLYLARYQRKTVLLTENIGGQTAISGTLENFPSYESVSGFELIEKMRLQAEKSGLEIISGFRVKKLSSGSTFKIESDTKTIEARTVLITSGKRHRTLGLENESKLIGKGVSYCATCDGGFARDKDVVIVGNGYAATESALILEKIAKSVTMVSISDSLEGERVTIESVLSKQKIKIVYNSKTIGLGEKEGLLEYVEVQDNDSLIKSKIPAKMVFIEIGQIPNSEIFDMLKINRSGEIEINNLNMTSEQGIFAAGDVTDVAAKQTIIACGEGAKAAISINRYLEKHI